MKPVFDIRKQYSQMDDGPLFPIKPADIALSTAFARPTLQADNTLVIRDIITGKTINVNSGTYVQTNGVGDSISLPSTTFSSMLFWTKPATTTEALAEVLDESVVECEYSDEDYTLWGSQLGVLSQVDFSGKTNVMKFSLSAGDNNHWINENALYNKTDSHTYMIRMFVYIPSSNVKLDGFRLADNTLTSLCEEQTLPTDTWNEIVCIIKWRPEATNDNLYIITLDGNDRTFDAENDVIYISAYKAYEIPTISLNTDEIVTTGFTNQTIYSEDKGDWKVVGVTFDELTAPATMAKVGQTYGQAGWFNILQYSKVGGMTQSDFDWLVAHPNATASEIKTALGISDLNYMTCSEGDGDYVLDVGQTLGEEQSSGTCTVDKHYYITATEADHFGAGKVVGDIFTSDGTETLDTNNKVKEIQAGLCSGCSPQTGQTDGRHTALDTFNTTEINGETVLLQDVGNGKDVLGNDITITGDTNLSGLDTYMKATTTETILAVAIKSGDDIIIDNNGTTYVNGVAASPDSFPFYEDGNDKYLGTDDGSTYEAVEDAEIICFTKILDSEEIALVTSLMGAL